MYSNPIRRGGMPLQPDVCAFLNRTLATLTAALVVVAAALAVDTVAGPYHLKVSTDPSVVPVGKANVLVRVAGPDKKPVSGLSLRAMASMPGMNMGEQMQAARPGSEAGEYVVPASFSMAGQYEVKLELEGPQGKSEAVVSLATGQDTSGGAASGFAWWPWLLVAGVIGFVAYRMHKTGQRLNVTSMLSGKTIGAIALLGAALIVTVWVVKTQRRPGAMTPIEAQAMEMATPPPEGTLPVRIATVSRGSFRATVRYSGQAVGFVEQDVVPRVTGTIVDMPVYVGSIVKRGQVLARLDTSALDPEVAMKGATVGRAQQGVGVASLEHQEALASVAGARAEAAMAEGGVAEAKAMQDATEQAKLAADAEVAAAKSEVEGVSADIAGAEAEFAYAQAQADRKKKLLDQGFVSRADYERTKADAAKAQAMVRQTEERRKRAQQAVIVAEAGVRKATAEATAARRRVQQAESNVRVKQADVRTSEKAAASARAKISQERATVQESAAALRGTTTQLGFATLRAETNGVVTSRLVSPGQTVSVGQAVLRVAQVSPLRLQANVPSADVFKIKVGAPVKVSAGDTVLTLRVSSVSPGLEPSTRTGVVEALYDNADSSIKPGQYLTMEIEVGSADNTLSVPSDAVDQRGTRPFVWVASPMSGDDLGIERRAVELGMKSQESTEILAGLEPGERVVIAPPSGLSETTTVREVTAEAVTGGLTVKVTSKGYEPPTVTIPAGKAVTVTFVRTTKGTCGTEVVIKALGINKPLPLNVPVKVKIPAQRPGRIKFTCAMDMLDGTVIVK